MNNKSKISIGYLGNLYFDTRCYNLFYSLKENGHQVVFNGFDWLTPGFETISKDEIKVDKLNKSGTSLLFYIRFAVRLLKNLYKQKSDIIIAEDVYSLPFCTIISVLRRAKLFYDSREVYTEIPALNDKLLVKYLIKLIEGFCIKMTSLIYTTGRMDSEYIEKLYSLRKTEVLRNLPLYKKEILPDVEFKERLKNNASFNLVYQGIIVKGRGIEKYFEMLQYLENCGLVLLGGGEHEDYYKKLANQMNVAERVIFAGKIPQEKLLSYTACCDLGVSIIDADSLNSIYALPNKMFEYIMAGVPVLINNLPQMAEIINTYKVGFITEKCNRTEILKIIESISQNADMRTELKNNCSKAAEVLNWQKEFQTIYNYFL